MIHKHNNDGMKIHAARKMNNIENQCGEKENVVIYLADARVSLIPGRCLGVLPILSVNLLPRNPFCGGCFGGVTPKKWAGNSVKEEEEEGRRNEDA